MDKITEEVIGMMWCTVKRFLPLGMHNNAYFVAVNKSLVYYVNDKGESQRGAHWFETFQEAVAAAELFDSKAKQWKLVTGPGVSRQDWDRIAQCIRDGQIEGDLK